MASRKPMIWGCCNFAITFTSLSIAATFMRLVEMTFAATFSPVFLCTAVHTEP